MRPNGRALRRPGVIVAALVAALVIAAAGYALAGHRSSSATGGGQGAVRIPADGAQLVAEVSRPSGRGPFPLVVMPASWGAGATEYRHLAATLTRHGDVVVAYGQRGFGGSGGVIDFAGEQTQRDVSTVIDWALAHARADRHRIALAGISYGAGISLLAAERDPRIRTVVAMSGWSDMSSALAPNGAVASLSLGVLLGSSKVRDNLTPDVRTLLDDTASGDADAALAQLRALSATRSPLSGVEALNRNRTAVMIANAYEDSVLTPLDMVAFASRLTGPTRLQLSAGDHGMPEAPALYGGQSAVWDDAVNWLDHYLNGRNSASAGTGAYLTDVVTRAQHHYDSPAALTTGDIAQYLAQNASGGALTGVPTTGWTRTLRTATDSVVDLPAMNLDYRKPFTPAAAPASLVVRSPEASWVGASVRSDVVISGAPTLRVTAKASTPHLAFIAYLFDVSPDGVARLMTYAPVQQSNDTSHSQRTLTLDFQPVSWTLVHGHRLALVVDTKDPRFLLEKQAGSLTVVSADAAPTLMVPTG